MKRIAPAILALALAAGAGADEKTPASPKGPRLVVEPASFDFGNALPQKTLNKEFSIRNFGSEDLVIEGVSTTCGCTVAAGYSKVVKPGGSTPLRVSFETRAFLGHVERMILIRSNDPTKSPFEVKIEATVKGH